MLQGNFLRGYFERVFVPRNRAYFVLKVLTEGRKRRPMKTIAPEHFWIRGSRWHWNNWNDVIFSPKGRFWALTPDCEAGDCTWWASENRIFIEWGDSGLHEVQAGPVQESVASEWVTGMKQAEGPAEWAKRSTRLMGRRVSDGDPVTATYVSGGGKFSTLTKQPTVKTVEKAGEHAIKHCGYIFKSKFPSSGTTLDAELYKETISDAIIVENSNSRATEAAEPPSMVIHVETIQMQNVKSYATSLQVFMVNPDTGIPEVHTMEAMVRLIFIAC
eukprot:SAG31_NODE_5473_length_2519_cov_1.478099_3_plen_273_part_00